MVSYIDVSINTRWHLDKKKRGGVPDEIGASPKSDRNRVEAALVPAQSILGFSN